jgi:hypothetical protein
MPPLDQLADELATILASREAELRLEQAVYGIDSLQELALHELLATGLSVHHDVAREVHYPSTFGKKLSHRARCDLVLTPRGRPLRLDSRPPGLFDPVDVTPPGEALWLEVKVAYQYRTPDERHGGYGAQWRDAVVNDLRKMDADELIRHAALLLIAFTESREAIEQHLQAFEDVLVRKEVLAGFRQTRTIDVQDRIGHRACTAALWPTIVR